MTVVSKEVSNGFAYKCLYKTKEQYVGPVNPDDPCGLWTIQDYTSNAVYLMLPYTKLYGNEDMMIERWLKFSFDDDGYTFEGVVNGILDDFAEVQLIPNEIPITSADLYKIFPNDNDMAEIYMCIERADGNGEMITLDAEFYDMSDIKKGLPRFARWSIKPALFDGSDIIFDFRKLPYKERMFIYGISGNGRCEITVERPAPDDDRVWLVSKLPKTDDDSLWEASIKYFIRLKDIRWYVDLDGMGFGFDVKYKDGPLRIIITDKYPVKSEGSE